MNDQRILKILQALEELTKLSGEQETTKIIPNCEVIDSSPSGMTDYIIVKNELGYYTPAVKSPDLTYQDGDLVNLLIIKGTEPIAFQHGSGSGTGGYPSSIPLTTKGDLLTRDASNNIRLAVGSDGLGLIADSSETSGLRYGLPGMRVKNTSGATANEGDIGYVNQAGEYKTTTTAADLVSWVVVNTGGANNADISVIDKGRATVNYTSTAPSAGNYLTTSTVAGSALAQTYVSPAIFAVCLAAGSGGTVEALLLCNRVEVQVFNSENLLQISSSSDSAFSSTISGTPGATLVYNAPTGNENSIVPAAATQLAALVLWNTSKTPDEYALIQATDTGTNTITPVTTITGWSNGESIQVNSTTVTGTLGGATFFDVEIKNTTVIPALAVAVIFEATANDTGGPAQFFIHPYGDGVVANAKTQTVTSQVASISNRKYTKISLNQRRFCIGIDATGAATMTVVARLLGYVVAAP